MNAVMVLSSTLLLSKTKQQRDVNNEFEKMKKVVDI